MDREKLESSNILIGGEEYTVSIGKDIGFDKTTQHIDISEGLLEECQGDVKCAASWIQLMWKLQYIASSRVQRWTVALAAIINNPRIYRPFIETLQEKADPLQNDPLVQCFFLSHLTETNGLHPYITNKLAEPIAIGKVPEQYQEAWKALIAEYDLETIADGLECIVQECKKYDLDAVIEGLQSGAKNPLKTPLRLLSSFVSSQGLLELCKELATTKQAIQQERKQQEEQKHNEKKKREITEGSLQEGQESYKPQDSIQNLEGEKTVVVIGRRYPPIGGYFKEKIGHHFDRGLEWKSELEGEEITSRPEYDPTHRFEAVLPGSGGSVLVPIPNDMVPVAWNENEITLQQGVDGTRIATGAPGASLDIGCVPQTEISEEDRKDIPTSGHEVFKQSLVSRLDTSIQDWFAEQTSKAPKQLISVIAGVIQSKIYSTEYQGTYQQAARDADAYITALWNAEKLECYSANHLMVALARHIGFPARIVMGYHTKFVHKGATAITQDDGHAWCEIYIDGVWQRWDVTPITPDPDDPSQSEEAEEGEADEEREEGQEDTEEGEALAGLEQELPVDEKMRRELIDSLKQQEEKKVPEVAAQLREGVLLEQAKQTYELLQKNKHRSEAFAQQLKDWLQTFTEHETKQKIYTKRNTGQVAMHRIMSNAKLLNQDPEELLKLANEELPIWESQEMDIEKKVGLPDELCLHIYLDVSGSMDDHFGSVKNDLVMIWDSMRHIHALTQHLGMDVSVEVFAFGNEYVQFSHNNATKLQVDMSDASIATLSHLLYCIPGRFQVETGKGNAENNFYRHIIQRRISAQEEENNLGKVTKHIGVSFTDQATLTDEPDGYNATTINDREIPAQTATERLATNLTMLQDLDLPVIAINCEGRAVGDSGYVSYIAGGDGKFATMPESLFKELKRLIPIEEESG